MPTRDDDRDFALLVARRDALEIVCCERIEIVDDDDVFLSGNVTRAHCIDRRFDKRHVGLGLLEQFEHGRDTAPDLRCFDAENIVRRLVDPPVHGLDKVTTIDPVE